MADPQISSEKKHAIAQIWNAWHDEHWGEDAVPSTSPPRNMSFYARFKECMDAAHVPAPPENWFADAGLAWGTIKSWAEVAAMKEGMTVADLFAMNGAPRVLAGSKTALALPASAYVGVCTGCVQAAVADELIEP